MKRYILRVQMQPEEYESFLKEFRCTLYKKKSHYARRLLLSEPVTVIHRNRSLDDLIEMTVGFRKDLRHLLSTEILTAFEKVAMEQRVLSIEEHLIQLIDICSHTSCKKTP